MSDCFNVDVSMIVEKLYDLHNDLNRAAMIKNDGILSTELCIEVAKTFASELKGYSEYLMVAVVPDLEESLRVEKSYE